MKGVADYKGGRASCGGGQRVRGVDLAAKGWA